MSGHAERLRDLRLYALTHDDFTPTPEDIEAISVGEAALREVAELRARLNDERARNERLHDDLLALTRPHLLTCPWCREDRSSNTASAQIMHLVQCGDKRHAQSANEIATLRARLEDARQCAAYVLAHAGEGSTHSSAHSARRVLALEFDRCGTSCESLNGVTCYRCGLPLAHPAPACPAVLAVCSECNEPLAVGANLDKNGDIEARVEPHKCRGAR